MESTIPRSRKESALSSPLSSWPKRKLSSTNCRSCCSMSGMRHLLIHLTDELVDHELRRRHAEEPRVVAEAGGAALAELPHELLHGERVEEAILFDPLRREQRVHVVEWSGEEALALGRPIRLFRPFSYRPRHQTVGAALEQVLFVQDLDLQAGRQPGRELDHAMIEEREPSFHGVG